MAGVPISQSVAMQAQVRLSAGSESCSTMETRGVTSALVRRSGASETAWEGGREGGREGRVSNNETRKCFHALFDYCNSMAAVNNIIVLTYAILGP